MPPSDRRKDLLQENADINRLLRQQADQGITRLHRPIERVSNLVGRPIFLYSALGMFAAWLLVNLGLKLSGRVPWDDTPFFWLQGAAGLLSLIVATSVRVAQVRQEQLAEQRAQLELQISLLAEQRTAKIIALLEELRRDLPIVHDRHDEEAEALQEATDPQSVIEVLQNLEDPGPAAQSGAEASR